MTQRSYVKLGVTILTVLLMVVVMTACERTNEKEIVVGMSTALSGPSSALGEGMKRGIETYFNKINDAGGVNGNMIRLIAYDDGYEPDQCAPNMNRLIDEDNVLAVIGNVGTPTAMVSVPIAVEKNTLLFGAFTGAGVLRASPPDRYVINYRASYEEETAAMVAGFIEVGIEPDQIAFFTQNDGYGDAGHQGAVKALLEHGYAEAEQLAHGRYTRNTVDIEAGLNEVVNANPRAVIMVGAYMPCAEFIKQAKGSLPNTIFANVSFVGSVALENELGPDGEGVIVTQVVPPFDSDLAGVDEYRQDLSTYFPDTPLEFVSLEGYLVAKIFVEGLNNAGASPTRESIVDALEGLSGLDVGINVPISYSTTNHQASHMVWPMVIRDGKYVTLDWADLAE